MDMLVPVLTEVVRDWARGRFRQQSTSTPESLRVTGRRELDRYAESIGEDERVLDNSRSDVEYTRAITITNSVERQFRTDVEQTVKESRSASLGVKSSPLTAELASHLEESYRKNLSDLSMRKHSVEERLEFKIPPRTSLSIVLKWKHIWQRGEISITTDSGQVLTIPYHESVSLEFDIDTATLAD